MIADPLRALGVAERAKGAFLAAAYGDALGWPQEPLARRIKDRRPEHVTAEFRAWTRRVGGRFQPHEEAIAAGEYSDDTQLILCSARSKLLGDVWWRHFAESELPSWTFYERGGGGATKRAALSWLKRESPWTAAKLEDRRRYFDAGGNGVVMRILPHCVAGANSGFNSVAAEILANGVCTHGHPRALVGALAYGYALWWTLRREDVLEYGAIVRAALEHVAEWGSYDSLEDYWPGWIEAASSISNGGYRELWDQTVDEMQKALGIVKQAVAQGALAVDREVLSKIGTFTATGASGITTAAAALFLSSQYASDPIHGLLAAAYAEGADTDTIASTTGALLGSVAGGEWLPNSGSQVQDSGYLVATAARLASLTEQSSGTPQRKGLARRSSAKDFAKRLEQTAPAGEVLLPDGRTAVNAGVDECVTLSSNLRVRVWKVHTSDDQTIYVKKIQRTAAGKQLSTRPAPKASTHASGYSLGKPALAGVRVLVEDVERSCALYEALGLKLVKRTTNSIDFGVLSLVSRAYYLGKLAQIPGFHFSASDHPFSVVHVETSAVDVVVNRLQKLGARVLSPVSSNAEYRFARCVDADGNVLELFERNALPPANSNGAPPEQTTFFDTWD